MVGDKKEKVKYFNYSEFDSPDVQGSGQMMNKLVLDMLDEVREKLDKPCLLYTSPSPRDRTRSRMPSSA